MSNKGEEKRIDRIISLAPSNTEILFALGLDEAVVGVTSFCDYPPEAKTKARIKGYSTPSLEKIIELRPNLVVATQLTPQEVIENLRQQGIIVFSMEPPSLDDVITAILALGEITHSQEKAEALVSEMRTRISRITDVTNALAPEQKPRVFFWGTLEDPTYTAGPGSYLDDLIRLAGGVNTASDLSEAWPEFSLKMLVVSDPQVICCSYMSKQNPDKLLAKAKQLLASYQGWEQISAVKSGSIFFISSDCLKRPGPRLVYGLEQMARCIYPELFSEGGRT